MIKTKEIYFCVDEKSLFFVIEYLNMQKKKEELKSHSIMRFYDSTEWAIRNNKEIIVTTSLAHLSFDLITLGYDIYLCYKDKRVKIEPHMDLSGIGEPGKDLRFGHNIFKMFRAGIFNELLGIKEGGKE